MTYEHRNSLLSERRIRVSIKSGMSEKFMFNKRMNMKVKRSFFKKSGKIREIVDLISFYFRTMLHAQSQVSYCFYQLLDFTVL